MTSTRIAAALAFLVCSLMLALAAAAGAATITPNSTADDFDAAGSPDLCSLREAIQNAVTNTASNGCPTAGDGGTDTIVLTAPASDTYTITIGANGNETNTEDDFDVGGGGPIVIRGTGGATIDTLATDRIFDVKSGADLALEDLTVQGGDVTSALTTEGQRGGNIRANSTSALTLDGVTVRLGDSGQGGGGIYSGTANELTIIDSSVHTNEDKRQGAGLFVIGNSEPVQITRSLITLNDATTDDDGVGVLQGGGIWFSGEQMTIEDSEVSYNSSTHDGTAASDGATGGAIRSGSNISIRRSLIRNNTVAAANGTEERGGAIMAEGGDASETISIVNSTIFDNTAGDSSGEGEGGAIFAKDDADPETDIGVSLAHVTFGANDATDFDAGNNLQTGTPADTGTITVRSSIIPGIVGPGSSACAGPNVASGGFNVAQQTSACGFGGSDSVSSSSIGTVAGAPVDNGGFEPTVALELGGRAVDFVPAAQCATAEGQDQRGYPRPLPLGGACDAGAYELHSCDGATVLSGPYVACPVPTQPGVKTTPKKKCKKKKKRKGKRGGVAAKKKKKKCKKKKKKRK